MIVRFIIVIGLGYWFMDGGSVNAALLQTNYAYKSSVSTDANGPLDLIAELNYDTNFTNAPIAVVMHGFSPTNGNLADVRANAQRLRAAGFFTISVAMRGRDGSDGVRDDGGVEIYDIYDAVEAVIKQHGSKVDPTNIHITGYSGGGGNTMAALTKFPDYFRVGSSYFGVSDYGYNNPNSFYYTGSSSSHRNILINDVGNPTLGNALIQDKYQTRASNLASKNNPYSEIHLFVNQNEPTCPPFHDTLYRDNAIAAATAPGEFDNIHVHIGGVGAYQDFDGDMINDPDEAQNWPHGFPTANQQHAAESWYLDRLLSGDIPQPVLNSSDELFVTGFVKTKPFALWLGDGQNASGELSYSLSNTVKTFDLDIASNNKSITGKLTVDTADMAGKMVEIEKNGESVSLFLGGGVQELTGFGNGDNIEFTAAGTAKTFGDFNLDNVLDVEDYAILIGSLPSTHPDSSLLQAYQFGDMNGDREIDFDDVLLFRTAYDLENGDGSFDSLTSSVPEIKAAGIACISIFAVACVWIVSRFKKAMWGIGEECEE